MAGQSITFDFLTRGADSTASGFRKVGDNTVLAAKGAKVLADAIEKLGQKEDRTAAESKILASALRQTGDAEDRVAARAVLADAAIRRLDDSMQDSSKTAAKAGAGFSGLAGAGGIPGGGMGAAIAAGVVLSPVIATLAVGLGGLGLAALSVAKNQKLMAQELAPLKAQFAGFSKALQPEVLAVFGTGIKIAGGLLHDIQPVAAATGKALDGLLGRVDAEFKSGTWQQFFQFMADSAGPDIKLVGDSFINLMQTLPPLLQAMQPIATEALTLVANFTRLTSAVVNFGASSDTVSKSVGTNVGALGFLTRAIANVTSFLHPGGVAAGALKSALDGIPPSAGKAGASLGGTAVHAMTLAGQLAAARAETNKLTSAENAALSPLLAYSNALITQKNDANALNTALKTSHDRIGLNTAAQRASFSAAQTYIQDLLNTAGAAVKSHQGIDAQIGSIRGALPLLQNVKGGTRQYWQEVSTLVGWLHKLQAIKLIQESIHVNASGVWSVTPGKIGLPGGTAGGPFAAGGLIRMGTGPTADDVPIRASRGEFVHQAKAVNKYGVGAMEAVNAGRAVIGYASGGVVGSYGPGAVSGVPRWAAGETNATVSAVARSTAEALIAGMKAAALTASRVPNVGSGVARWAPLVRQALAMEGLSPGLLAHVLYQIQTESGGNPNAINLSDSNAARGDPSRGLLQTIGSTFRAYHWPGTSNNIYDPLANIAAALNYARHRYGPSLMSGGMGIGSGHGYALGGLVPGYASGGTVARQGAAWLKAWKSRHGGGYGAAWGPVPVNQQIPEMAAAMRRAQALAGASGLSPGQHRFWAAAAADEKRRLGVLGKERDTERAWRTQLGLNELGLDKEIRAAGNLPSLRRNVAGWKAQMGRDKATIAGISRMLGYSDAYLASHKPPPPGPVLPKITHTYGGDVADNLGTVLAAALGPFTGAARGGMVFDRGGVLRPGWNAAYNGTGRPEALVPARGGGTLQIEWVGGNGGDELERWIRKNVRVRGGGNVQKAWGSH